MKKIFNNGPIWVRFDTIPGSLEFNAKVAYEMGTRAEGGVVHLCNVRGMARTVPPTTTIRNLLGQLHKCK